MAAILIAEDDASIGRLLSLVIKNMGHTPMISPNGRHAWEALQANPDIRMLLADYMMPEINGRDLIIMVRNDPKLKDLPVIMVSAVVGPKAIADLLDIGVTLFLAKPVDMNMLQEYILRYVDAEVSSTHERT